MEGATPMGLHAETITIEDGNVEQALDLSESRTYDCALEILRAHKLTGNFHVNLEIVLEHLGAFDDLTFEIEPKSQWVVHRDCRHVVFRPNENVDVDRLNEIMHSVRGRIGFDAAPSWRGRLFHQLRANRRPAGCLASS
jgi:hypothetical protein